MFSCAHHALPVFTVFKYLPFILLYIIIHLNMRTRSKFLKEVVGYSLKNIKRVEVKFNPFHANALSVREFFDHTTSKKAIKSNPECVTKVQIVSDNSDPLVTIQFNNNHKLVLNSKHLESNHIIKLCKQFETIHKDVPEEL